MMVCYINLIVLRVASDIFCLSYRSPGHFEEECDYKKKKKKLKLAICQHQTGERGQKIYAMYTVLLDEKLD